LPLLLGIHFKQAIEALEDVQVFLEHRGYVEQATTRSPDDLIETLSPLTSYIAELPFFFYTEQAHC